MIFYNTTQSHENAQKSCTKSCTRQSRAIRVHYRPSNLDKKVANINQASPREQFAHESETANSQSGIDDLPEIKAFPKNEKKPNNVLKSMVNKIK